MLNAVDARRRWFCTFFLIVAGGLLLWGMTFLSGFLLRHPVLFVTYWLTCFGLTFVSFVLAIYDMRVMRRRMREEQRAAFDRAFQDVTEDDARG